MAPLVDVDELTYHYPRTEVAALDRVHLALDGGLCVVAGPSGGGKSTLLRLFNGLVPHLQGGRISGRAMVDGRDVLRSRPRDLATTVGFVFQDAERQAVHSTVERDIAFGLENRCTPATEMRARVEAIMADLAISHLRTRTIATLSGGERQRVAIAGALVLRPRLLALDEPLSQLDGAGAAALLKLCSALTEDGVAVVMSEHRLDELLPVATSLVTVDDGRVTGPSSPAVAAASLDSAPQIVRLSNRLGWSPPLLDPRTLRMPPLGAVASTPRHDGTRRGDVAWRLDAVSCGPDALLDGVTMGGAAGEICVVMGANGAGKTTLLRTLAGLTAPRSGTVWRRPGRVAYLPQNPAALLHRESVAAEVAWTARGLRDHGPEAQRAIMDVLDVTAIAERDPRDLSSGQRQRAAIAAVLSGRPDLVLLDEPTRGMDGAARAGLVAAARLLAGHGAAVVLATHDADLAADVADRVFLIAQDTLHDAGAPERALSGAGSPSTQLGRLFDSPGPVTVDAVASLYGPPVGARRVT